MESGFPSNVNAVQKEISEELTRITNELFRKYGNHERLQDNEKAAILYRNLFNLLLGAYCAEEGINKTIATLRKIVEAENKFAVKQEKSPIILM